MFLQVTQMAKEFHQSYPYNPDSPMIRILYIHGDDSDKIPPGSDHPEWQITPILESDLQSILPIPTPYHIAIWHTSNPEPSFIQKAFLDNIANSILVFTSSNNDFTRVEVLRSGAEDIINDTISEEEFILRIQGIIKRNNQDTFNQYKVHIGNYVFDYERRMLTIGNDSRTLTTKESELLKMLAHHKNKPVSKQDALTVIWGGDSYHNGRSMDVYIGRLRKYLQSDNNIHIFNIHGMGYKLTVLSQN